VEILKYFRTYFRFSQTDYKKVIPLIIIHLESLTENLDQCFPSLSSEMYGWVRNPQHCDFEDRIQWSVTWCVLDFNKKRVSCDLSKSSEHLTPVFSFLPLNKLSHVWQTLKAKKEIVCCLSRKNCECVCQKFGQEFNICTKRNKPKGHTESKPCIDFGCELYFDV
jgi:hypothetical protein